METAEALDGNDFTISDPLPSLANRIGCLGYGSNLGATPRAGIRLSVEPAIRRIVVLGLARVCLLYTSDAADDRYKVLVSGGGGWF